MTEAVLPTGAAEPTAAPTPPEPIAPLCDCHGEPKRWHKRAALPNGGYWECRVKHREAERSRYHRDPAPRLSYQSAWYEKNRDKELARKSSEYRRRYAILTRLKTLSGCARCGYRDNAYALVFHHRNPAEKERTVSAFLRAGWTAVRRELAKCEVLCANCHAITHAEMRT